MRSKPALRSLLTSLSPKLVIGGLLAFAAAAAIYLFLSLQGYPTSPWATPADPTAARPLTLNGTLAPPHGIPGPYWSVQSGSAPTGPSDPTAAPPLTFNCTLASPYGIPGPYCSVHAGLAGVGTVPCRGWGCHGWRSSCADIARGHVEPFSEAFRPRNTRVGDWPGGAPRAFFRWQGNISRKDFDDVPVYIRGDCPLCCAHCTFTVRYKFLGGRLYRRPIEAQYTNLVIGGKSRVEPIEELLLVASYLYAIPDTDFILHWGDGAPKSLPILNFNIDRQLERAGFTMPTYDAWKHGLGPEQMKVMATCLAQRYPADKRIAKAIWRGSTTDPRHASVTQDNFFDIMRIRLHTLGHWYGGILDAKLSALVQTDGDFDAQVQQLGGLADRLSQEDFNRYAVIIDIDGNAWSSRLTTLLKYNTLLLKQASTLTEWFGHLIAPGMAVEHFAPDLSDLVTRLQGMLTDWQGADRSRITAMIGRTQGLAHALLNHVAVAEAMAYAVTKYGELAEWQVQQEVGYEEVPRTLCCRHASLPKEFVRALRSS